MFMIDPEVNKKELHTMEQERIVTEGNDDLKDKAVNCLQKVNTLLNADSVEFCPFPKQEHILLCGTYKLEECSSNSSPPAVQTRLGGVKVFHVQHKLDDMFLKEVKSLDMCGVLDIKWPKKPVNDQSIFGLVDAEGFLQILKLEDSQTLSLVTKGLLSESSLGLSLEWSGSDHGNDYHIACSDSTGCITVYELGEDMRMSSQWSAHGYEAWITAFHNFNNKIVYSGGDDCLLKVWDLRDTSKPVLVSRRHQMGVCSIQSHPLDENIFASGSYDEKLLIWDRRNAKHPLTDTSLGGGIWRIKWEPNNGKHILTATMYNGAHIVDCEDLGKAPLPILAQYSDHNLAYGADWCRHSKSSLVRHGESDESEDTASNKTFIVSTCSFYDQSLHLWE